MEQNLNNNNDFKEKLILFYKKNKFKIYSFLTILLIGIISITFFKIDNKKKNNLIAEEYVKAGLYLTSNNKENAKKIYDEIILSNNKFYSVLSLNTIVEKNLETDKEKILNYFAHVENIVDSNEQRELIIFKKSLYLINISREKEGYKLLNDLIGKNSKLKSIAEEIIKK